MTNQPLLSIEEELRLLKPVFGFTDEDLSYNRRGELSPSQDSDNLHPHTKILTPVILLLVCFLAATQSAIIFILLIISFAALYFLHLNYKHNPAAKQVMQIQGHVIIVPYNILLSDDWRRRTHLRIGDYLFPITLVQISVLRIDRIYRVYFLSYANRIVAIEPVEQSPNSSAANSAR